jgi:hypothetical protein
VGSAGLLTQHQESVKPCVQRFEAQLADFLPCPTLLVPGFGFNLLPHKYLLSYYTVLNSEGFKSVALYNKPEWSPQNFLVWLALFWPKIESSMSHSVTMLQQEPRSRLPRLICMLKIKYCIARSYRVHLGAIDPVKLHQVLDHSCLTSGCCIPSSLSPWSATIARGRNLTTRKNSWIHPWYSETGECEWWAANSILCLEDICIVTTNGSRNFCRAVRRENVRFKKLVSAIFTILGLVGQEVAAHRTRGVW